MIYRPAGLWLSTTMLERLDPDALHASEAARRALAEHMLLGDTQPARVVELSPELLVAAYSTDLDATILLAFPKWVGSELALSVGQRLACAGQFDLPRKETRLARDVLKGPHATESFHNVRPLVLQVFADDAKGAARRVRWLDELAWSRLEEGLQRYQAGFGLCARNGRPSRMKEPARRLPP